MNAAFLLSTDPNVFQHAADVLRGLGATYSDVDGGSVQLYKRRGRTFYLWRLDNDSVTSNEWLDPPDEIAPGVQPPAPGTITACLAECRDEARFIELAGLLARKLEEPLWVLDSGGTLWDADRIDPERLIM